MSDRKERKARRIELTREWALIAHKRIKDIKDKDISEVILMTLFKSFCILHHIDKPQDRVLRNHIILGATKLLKLIKEAK